MWSVYSKNTFVEKKFLLVYCNVACYCVPWKRSHTQFTQSAHAAAIELMNLSLYRWAISAPYLIMYRSDNIPDRVQLDTLTGSITRPLQIGNIRSQTQDCSECHIFTKLYTACCYVVHCSSTRPWRHDTPHHVPSEMTCAHFRGGG